MSIRSTILLISSQPPSQPPSQTPSRCRVGCRLPVRNSDTVPASDQVILPHKTQVKFSMSSKVHTKVNVFLFRNSYAPIFGRGSQKS